jgi:phage protein D
MGRFIFLLSIGMIAFLNMNARVTLGNVRLNHVSQFEISESILEISNTAKLTIPKGYGLNAGKAILAQFKAGDRVTIEAGYNGDLQTEFTGYISEIDSDIPLVISCEGDLYPLRQTNYVKSYSASATLKQILWEIIPAGTVSLDVGNADIRIGKYQIDNASAFAVLQDLLKDYGLYGSVYNGVLRVGPAYDYGENRQTHEYVIGKNVKKNELKYKRKEDFKVRFKAVASSSNGKKTSVTVGAKELDASERTLNFAGPMTEGELKQKAESALVKVRYDGYTGSITGFGTPRTHAGDALQIRDVLEKDNEYRDGSYLIEKVAVLYNESSGFSRQNTLSYKIGNKAGEA